MIDTIQCTNKETRQAVVFQRLKMSPFMLKSVDGVSSFKNNITMEDHTMIDGAEYLGSVQQKRNIVISGKMMGDLLSNKELLYEVFNTGSLGEILITDSDGAMKTAEYYTESVDADGDGLIAKTFSISLICPDPAFYDSVESLYTMANWVKKFTFTHNFTAEKEEFGTQSKIRLVDIPNYSGVPTGLTIIISAVGDVLNPAITNSRLNKHIKIGDSSVPFTLENGQKLIITTGDGNKHIYLQTDEDTLREVNQYLTDDSEFFQLVFGSNPIAYSADSGDEYMTVDITFHRKYRGA